MRERILKKIEKDRERGVTLMQLCSKIGVPYGTLWRMIQRNDGVRIGTWEKAEEYYRNRRKFRHPGRV